MLIQQFSRGKFAKATKLGAGLLQNRTVLEKIAVRSLFDLRRAVAAKRLSDAGIGPDDLKEIVAFASLTRIFPANVALALLDQGADNPAALTRWNEDKFAKALSAAGIGGAQSATEQQRFARFRELAKKNPHPGSVTGLQIDLGEDYALLKRHASELAAEGVEIIADWAHLRSSLKVDSATRQLLDGYARLSVLGLGPKTVKHLLAHNIDSVISLTQETDSDLERLAKSGGIQSANLFDARQMAFGLTTQLGTVFDNLQLDEEKPIRFVDWSQPCVVCPENESVFSKFAYYLYLIEKTGRTFHELEITLFQDFSRMTPADGDESLPQPMICNQVLQGLLGRNLTPDEGLSETRYRVLAALRMVVPRSPAQIVAFWDGLSPAPFAADRLPRLLTAYGAPPPLTDDEMLNPPPVFTREEVETLGQIGETILIQEIQSEPAFIGATPQELREEASRRVAERTEAEVEFTLLIRRAALKKALHRTDPELFALLFIETDLPLCERTTRLDQAIRTLQAYLTKNGTSSPRYLSFTAWRGEALGKKYPATTVLLRDDVLVGDTGTWDRGSILRNHAVQYAELKSQLSAVRSAINEARVDIDNDLDLEIAHWNALSKFKDEPYYEYFQRGLEVIDDILDANDKIYRAAGDLDKEEPGLALSKLQSALSQLDHVDGELFDTDAFWANQDSALKRYAELVKMNPAARKELLLNQFFNFCQTTKKIYALLQPSPTVAGLTDMTVLQVDNPAWSASPEFDQVGGLIVRNETDDLDTVSEFRYREGWNLDDYTFSCEFRVRSYWTPTLPDRAPKIGIGFRLQDGSQGGYRLAVLRSTNSLGTRMDILALQAVSTGGAVTMLGEHEIGTQNSTDIEGSTIRTDHWYALSVTASGGTLSGSLKTTPEKTIPLGPVQDATFDKGTMRIFVRGDAEVEFRNLSFRSEGLTGAPPFFAQSRVTRRSTLSDAAYLLHMEYADPMSLELLTAPLAIPIDTYKKQPLAGVKRGDNNLYLTFPPGGSMVFLGRLDQLLEQCLVMTYYLRFAAIPVRMSQAYLMLGESSNATDLLHVLYDEEPNDWRERRMYPFFDGHPYADSPDLGADTAAMRLRLGEVYLRWAEMLFRQNTESSRYEARRRYERVLQVHWRENCDCVEQQRRASGHVLALARQARSPGGTAAAREVSRRNGFVRLDLVSQTKNWREVQELIQSERQAYRAKVKADGAPENLAVKALKRIKAAELKMVALRGRSGGTLNPLRRQYTPFQATRTAALPALSLCTPDNPLESAQTTEACLRLSMLKSCVNILGYSDDLVPPLRFDALLRVAENFANLAHAAERDVLQFRQQFEQEAFALMQAEANLEQANVEVALEQLNVELAEGEIALAEIQEDQAAAGVAHFESLVSEGMTDTERKALAAADAAAQLAAASAIFSFATTPVQLLAAGLTGGGLGLTDLTNLIGGQGQIIGQMGNAFSAQASALGMRASLERQQQDREFQLEQTRFGLSIALQNVSLAFQRWEVSQLQEELAGMRRDFARDALAFLNNKMLSAAGWLMLMKVAREQYRRRLSYAIEMSYLAERALAFELQNPALKIIRFDYYDPRKDGLLGATQLLTDLAQLESRKLAFRQRKLQLSKTISLAALFPAAFEQFRDGPGIFVFGTLPGLFDRDLPGHYLRLIQSVRVTVVALVPPTQGIRATFKNNGVSQVVVGPPYASQFGARTIRRNPESVALSSPFEASGVFVLDYKDDLLLPFEGSGVVSDWVFEMPKAANQFSYDTIADVLITLDYTALEGTKAYRDRVVSQLGREFRAERAYSFHIQFADQWYDLHNPELIADPAQQMVVKCDVLRSDFPPNLDQLAIEHVALYFAHDDLAPFTPVPVRYLNFANDGNRDGVNSDAQGVITTRRGSGSGSAPGSWLTVMAGTSPVAKWEISFNFGDAVRDQAIRERFKKDKISDGDRIRDILLVISYRGRATAWP